MFTGRILRHSLPALILLLYAAAAHAQHVNAWTRLTVTMPVQERWKLSPELQLRRQNTPPDMNIVRRPLLWSFRPWVYYSLKKNVWLAAAPFAYFRSYEVLNNVEQPDVRRSDEWRHTIAVGGRMKMTGAITIQGRLAAEYRTWGLSPAYMRYRARGGAGIKMTERASMNLSYEYLMSTSVQPMSHMVTDQQRIVALLKYNIVPDILAADAGYMYLLRYTGAGTGPEHDIVCNIRCNLKSQKKH